VLNELRRPFRQEERMEAWHRLEESLAAIFKA